MPELAAPPSLPALPRLDVALRDIEGVRAACEGFRTVYAALREEIGRVIVGQDVVVDETMTALFADGHVLLEGVPGLGKTLLVRTLGEALSLPFARIQFTPDVMPADITGTSIVVEDPESGRRTFRFRPGPIFHQLVLADEINRATPKSQSALLEAMQERSVSIAGTTHTLTRPFFVLATQNPIEQEGTYPLPEAQLDRFLLKVVVPYADRAELNRIVRRTTATGNPSARQLLDGGAIQQAQRLARRIVIAPHVQDYAIRLVLGTHPGRPDGDREIDRLVRIGVSPRGAQALVTCAKVRALVDGRFAVGFRDIIDIALPALRHRIARTFEAEADGTTTDDIIRHLIETTPRSGPDPADAFAPRPTAVLSPPASHDA
ncbi:MAG: MoxR family ATPase [Phycisphaerales bacterium]|nr:AAA family ATPase [Phycisphaerae bacterium]NNF44497.1 MoxR family ATPase [Phycisphaerales bacterium]NNM26985.1 MoxR family ATPase [Phycisphaerales bacterium]